jgi:hypothetical protein
MSLTSGLWNDDLIKDEIKVQNQSDTTKVEKRVEKLKEIGAFKLNE